LKIFIDNKRIGHCYINKIKGHFPECGREKYCLYSLLTPARGFIINDRVGTAAG